MNSDNKNNDQVSRIVAEALLLPESERIDFARKSCGSNLELWASVQVALDQASEGAAELNWDRLTDEEFGLLDQFADDFENRLRSGDHPLIEDCLQNADKDLQPFLFHELLRIEINFKDDGLEEYKNRFPKHAPTIDSIYDATLDKASGHPQRAPGSIGRYRILQAIGKGGMGQVFLAEQTEPVKRRVAIKVIKTDTPSKEILARFEAERQALAMMDHPNIAKVLDAGVTDDGKPFFAMEFVKGIPITTFCEQNKLSTNERILLLIQTCRAIQHAHQKGIIHRDIKPTNVLVTSADGNPTAKVIDFGLAKALIDSTSLTNRTLHTQYGEVVGTLEFMSPEQAEMNVTDVDTRTDVYSLGVLFYELLTGRTPLGKDKLKSLPFDELLRAIREEEAIKPSHVLSDSSHSFNSSNDQKKHELRRLGQICRGDLDWIVLKSLEKDRARRYEGPGALADDLERFLAGEPIDARPPSFTYRLGKNIRKNRVAYSSSLVVLVAAIAISFMAWRNVQSQRNAKVRRNILSQIESSEFGPDIARISFEIDQVTQPDDKAELRKRLQARIGAKIDEFIEPDKLVNQWDTLSEYLGLISDESERLRKTKQIDDKLDLEYRKLISSSNWFDHSTRIFGIIELHSDKLFRSSKQEELERKFFAERIAGLSQVATDSQNSSREYENRRFIDAHQKAFQTSTLRAEFESFIETYWASQTPLEKTDELEEQISRIKRLEIKNEISKIIDTRADVRAKELIRHGLETNQDRHELKVKLERLRTVLPSAPLISGVLRNRIFVSPLVPVDLTSTITKFCDSHPSRDGSWVVRQPGEIKVEDHELGRDFDFSIRILNAKKTFFEVVFYVQNIHGKQDYPWKIYFKLSNDRKHVRTHVRYREEVVQSFLVPLTDEFQLGFHLEPLRAQIQVGNKVVHLHRLFEDPPESLFSIKFFGRPEFSNFQLSVGSTRQPIEPGSIRAADLAFLNNRYREAHDIYQDLISANPQDENPLLEFKALLSRHRKNRAGKETKLELEEVAKSLQFPISVYACNELLSDSLSNDRFEFDHFVPNWLFSCSPENFDDQRSAYSPNLTKQALGFVRRNQQDYRLMKIDKSKKEKLDELVKLTKNIRNYIPDTVLREFELLFFESYFLMDQKGQAQKYIQLLNNKTDSLMFDHGIYHDKLSWLAIQQGDTEAIKNCIDQVGLPGRFRDRFRGKLWQARLLLALNQSQTTAEAKLVLKEILKTAPLQKPRAYAALLYGLILEKENKEDEAMSVWQEAFEFCSKENILAKDLVFILLGSLTKKLDREGFQRCVELNLKKDLYTATLISLVDDSLTDEISQGLVKLYNSDEGRALAFRLASRQIDFVEFHFAPHVNGLAAVLLSSAFPDATENQKKLIAMTAKDGVDAWRNSELPQKALPNLIAIWSIPVQAIKQDRLNNALKDLPEIFRDRLRYLLAHRLKHLGENGLYEKLLKETANTSNALLKKLVDAEIETLIP